MIAIDDGSRDETLSILRTFGDKIIVKTGPNQGAPAARNRGLSLARGRYVMFLDADDYITGETVSSYLRSNESRNRHSDIIFGPWAYLLPDGKREFVRSATTFALKSDDIVCAWLEGAFVPPCGVMWRTEFVRKIGGWDETLLRNQDGELVLRGLLSGLADWAVADGGLGLYRKHHGAGRISQRLSPDVLASQTELLMEIEALADREELDPMLRSFAVAHYRNAREAFRCGERELGRRALGEARRLGLNKHPGTLFHAMASSLVGLERKEVWSSFVRSSK